MSTSHLLKQKHAQLRNDADRVDARSGFRIGIRSRARSRYVCSRQTRAFDLSSSVLNDSIFIFLSGVFTVLEEIILVPGWSDFHHGLVHVHVCSGRMAFWRQLNVWTGLHDVWTFPGLSLGHF